MFIFKLIVGIIMNVAIFGGLLLLPAGTVAWWRAWLFIGVVFVATVATMGSINEDLLDERFKPPIQTGQPLADKVVLVLLLATFCGLVVFIPLKVGALARRREAVAVRGPGFCEAVIPPPCPSCAVLDSERLRRTQSYYDLG